MDGKFTAFTIAPRVKKSDICSAICTATFSCASAVEAPRCGVQTTFSRRTAGSRVAGSVSNTSSAAPATWPLVQRLGQRRLVHQPAAGAVDDAHALLVLRQRLAREDVAGLVGERRVQGDEVGARQQLSRSTLLDAELERALFVRNGRRR